jgi:hypothetical protein
MPDLDKTYRYRLTYIRNIPHIHQFGITHWSSPNANSSFVPIGDESQTASRNLLRFMFQDKSKYLFILLLLCAIGCRIPADTRKESDLVQNYSSPSDGLIISGANMFIDVVRNDGVSDQISLVSDSGIIVYHILKSAGALSKDNITMKYLKEADFVNRFTGH